MEDAVGAASRLEAKMWQGIFAAAFFIVGVLTPAVGAEAATMFLSPSSASIKPGQTVSVGIYVESKSQAMNAAQGTLSFPQSIVEVTSISKGGSIINLWVQEPSFSNGAGNVSFEGITYNPGFQSASGKILTVTFKAKAAGTANVGFSSGSILANDGQGTNILAGLGKATITVSGEEAAPEEKPAEEPTAVPSAPRISSTTHPDPEKWYANRNPSFEWPLPSGVNGVNILADHNPTTDPGTKSDGVMRTYQYKNVDDGTWYAHLRFRNAKGWGAAAHFKFQIDTQKPSSFEMKEVAGREPEETTVRFALAAADALSGIDAYEFTLDGGSPVRWKDDGGHVYTLTGILSGNHVLTAKALDQAGNFLEKSVGFSIAAPPPPPAPTTVEVLAAAPATRLDLVIFYAIGLILLALLLWLFIWLRRKERETRPRMLERREINRMEEDMHRTFDELRAKVDEYALMLEKSRRRRLSAEKKSLQEENAILSKLKEDLEEVETLLRRRARR